MLGFTVLTIVWGAWVRISSSGDGCGNHWPLCKKSFLPNDLAASIEWLHRLTSGLALLFIFALCYFAFKIYPKKHLLRKLSLFAVVLILIEALIGALLVLNQLVGFNQSSLRVIVLGIHLINSLILVGVLTLCWQSACFKKITIKQPHIYFLSGFLFLALTGNIASLAGVLFPSISLMESLALDFLPNAHISLKIRFLHPLIALLFLIFLGLNHLMKTKLFLFALLTALFGLWTLLSLSPVWMKLSHLFIAYLLWIVFVSFSFQFHKTK
ncbi:MAG: COX15/CtaA family protein [Bdellovibrionales bacterium]